jgi:hypothetical protein
MVKKAHLVTGKGGVGKSLFSSVLALTIQRKNSPENQQILLTELSELSFFKDYLNLEQIGYKPTHWKFGIDVAQWSPDECLKEYALHLLKIESLYKLFIENPVSKSLIQVAPGLHELALLGKLTSSPRQHGPPMNYDQIVADSFSTGHFLSLLRAPSALHTAVPFGPMGEQTKSIDAFIRDPSFTEVHLVCFSEELPVTESIELYHQLKSEFGIVSNFYLNKMSDLKVEELDELRGDVKTSLLNVVEAENRARIKLQNAGINWHELPLVASQDVNVLIEKLSERLM